jgi:hypothetical protein
MKGVSQKCIELRAKDLGVSLFELYDDIITGIAHAFNVCLGGASFDMGTNFTIKSRQKFTRKISPPKIPKALA